MLILTAYRKSGSIVHEFFKSNLIVHRICQKRTKMTALVAVMQMSSTNDKQKNFEACRSLILEAKQRGAVMVFLPENSDYMATSKEETFALAERFDLSDTPQDNTILGKLRLLSKEVKIWLSVGGLHRMIDEPNKKEETRKLWNTHVLIDDEGRVVATYEKLHLFDVDIDRRQTQSQGHDEARDSSESSVSRVSLSESRAVHRGSRLVEPVATPIGRLGLSVCYDLRFPELASWQRARGAEVLTYPSAFTYVTGVAHWETLLRARAIETQCYVIAAAQTGQHSATRRSYGHAMVVDPFGCVRAQVREGLVGCCYADVDLADLVRIRKQMPVAAHRRVDLFGPACGAPRATGAVLHDADVQDVLLCEEAANAALSSNHTEPFTEDRSFGPHRISAGYIFYESALSFAFVNLRPIVPGHVLVVPKRVVPRVSQLLDAEATDLFRVARRVQRVIEPYHGACAANLAVQDGEAAGQTVPHVHIHILPRRVGDFRKADEVHESLENWEKVRVNRSDGEMREEAARFRKLFQGQEDL